MQKQIRINKTPQMESILLTLKAKKYPLLEENEIIKYLLSREFSLILKTQAIPTQRTPEQKKGIQAILDKLYQEAASQKLAEKWLAKKGLKSDDVSEDQFLDLLYEEDDKGNS